MAKVNNFAFSQKLHFTMGFNIGKIKSLLKKPVDVDKNYNIDGHNIYVTGMVSNHIKTFEFDNSIDCIIDTDRGVWDVNDKENIPMDLHCYL